MTDTVTKVELTDLPSVLQEKINRDIDNGYSVLDIEKTVTKSKKHEVSYVDFRAKLNRGGFFIDYTLHVYTHRNAVRGDIQESYVTSADILFYITKNKELHRKVSDLINSTNES
ncbi:MAG TPA: hypothetical protein VKZ95_04725 [Sphingobacteriaceae bacterium]|nr:hypothetical protein [Sphingobacteriaceae bacterium]